MKNFGLFFSLLVAGSFAVTSAAQADVTWTAGAPSGTSGGAVDFGGDPTTDRLFTGVLGDDFSGNRTAGDNTGSDYTASMWINSDTAANNEWWLGISPDGNNGRGVHLGIQNGSTLEVGHWGADSSGTTVIAANTWVHATFTFDADGGAGGLTGRQSIYLNGGFESATDNAAPLVSGGEIQIGARRGATGPAFNGKLDDVALWNSVLSAANISDLHDGTQTALALGADAYYDFEDDQLGTVAAVQSNGTSYASATTLTGITANAVPEPSSLALLLGLGAMGFVRRKRS